jgi:cytochrome c peroxidase
MRLDTLSARLARIPGYRELFARAYPGATIDGTLVGKAIASFERTVVSGTAPFDRWVDGNERAISDEAKRGFALFNGKANCATCHSGWRFTDDSFHDIGIAGSDSGRVAVLPGIEAMRFAFKTPTLRDLVSRAPYMHDGSERTLAEVVELYDRGGRVRRPSLSAEIKPLGLTAAEKRELLAFLATLDAPAPAVHAPVLPR